MGGLGATSRVLQQGSADLSQRMTVDSNRARQMSSFSYADAQRHAFTHTYTEKQLSFVNEILDGFYVTHCLDLEMSSGVLTCLNPRSQTIWPEKI